MNEKEVGISFVIMPIEILQDKSLTPSEKILYCYLTIFKKQCCFQSNATIEENTGLDTRSIQRGLKKLEELKYVYIEFVNNNSAMRRIYTVLDNPNKLAYLSRKGMFSVDRASVSLPKVLPTQMSEPVSAEKEHTEPRPRPNRKDFTNDEEYEKAFYSWNKCATI